MAPPAIDKAIQQAQGLVRAAVLFTQELAFELRTEANEALRTGLGIPKAVTSIASFGCFAVAAAGTASITADFVGKMYGAHECSGCNGWEGVACGTCRGTGRTRRQTVPAVGSSSKSSSSSRSVVVASPPLLVDQSAADTSSPCATCNGSGVMNCTVCNGDAWKNKITFDRILDSPVKAWDTYRMTQPVMPSSEAMQNPSHAAFWLLQRPELEDGREMGDEEKQAVWWDHQWKQRYNVTREAVLKQEPGWQEAYQALVDTDPSFALNDPQLSLAIATAKSAKSSQAAKTRRLPKLDGDVDARLADTDRKSVV